MPDMTAEQITAMQAAALENDPQPEPLNAPIPEGVTRVTVYRHAGQSGEMESHVYDLAGEVSVETAQTGALMVHSGGSTIGFAPGYWAHFDITDATEAGEVQ